MPKPKRGVAPDAVETTATMEAPERSQPRMRYREFSVRIDREALAKRAEDSTDESIPIAISSEFPVERYDWWEGERYLEILDHSPEAVDLSRAIDGLPFLIGHDQREHVGLVEDVRVDEDRVMRGDVIFSRSQRGQEIRQDMLDGIRKKISVGYMPDMNNVERKQEKGETMPTERVLRWTPLEVSVVPIPADPTVGVGRGAPQDFAPLVDAVVARVRAAIAKEPEEGNDGRGAEGAAPREEEGTPDIQTAPTGQREKAMPDTSVVAPGGAETAVAVGQDFAAERQRQQDIVDICRSHRCSERAGEFIAAGKTVSDVLATIRQEHASRQTPSATPDPKPPVELNGRDSERYSLLRLFRAVVDGKPDQAGFEMEIHQELSKKLGRAATGVLVPTHLGALPKHFRGVEDEVRRRALDAATATGGKELVFTEPGSFIDMLRSRLVLTRMGAQFLPGLQGNVSFPRQDAAGTFSWVDEVSDDDTPEDSDLSTGNITLTPKQGRSITSVSRTLLAQSVIDVEQLIRRDLSAIAARGLDKAGLHGSGGREPTGLYNMTGVNAVAFDGTITYPKIVEMETAIAADDADIGTMAYVTTPEIRGAAKTTQIFSGTNGAPIWTGGVEDGEMNGYRAFASNQLSKTLGTSSPPAEHGILFGVWENVLVGEWGAMEILIDPYTRGGRGLIRLIVFLIADVNCRYPEAFAKGTGLVLTAAET